MIGMTEARETTQGSDGIGTEFSPRIEERNGDVTPTMHREVVHFSARELAIRDRKTSYGCLRWNPHNLDRAVGVAGYSF